MKLLLSVACKLITTSIFCQTIMLGTLYPARPLPKSPVEQEQAKQELQSKLQKLSVKLGGLKNNLSTLKQRLSDLKQKLPAQAKTPPASTPSSTGKGTAPETGPKKALADFLTLESEEQDERLKKWLLPKLQRLVEVLDKKVDLSDKEKLAQEKIKRAIEKKSKPEKPEVKDKPMPAKTGLGKPGGAPSVDFLEEIAKGKKLTPASSTKTTPKPASSEDLDTKIAKAANDSELTAVLKTQTIPTLFDWLSYKFPRGYSGTQLLSYKDEEQALINKIIRIIDEKADLALQNLAATIGAMDEKSIKEGLSYIMNSVDDLRYVFELGKTYDTAKAREDAIKKISITTQSVDTLFKMAQAVVNDTIKDASMFMQDLHKSILDAWLINFENAILTGSTADAIKYLQNTIQLCDQRRSKVGTDKVNFLPDPDPKKKIQGLFEKITDNQKALDLAHAGLKCTQEIIARKTTK